MSMLDIITKKRDRHLLSKDEIEFVVQGYTLNEIPDYQMAAWLMAVYFQGMGMEETAALTMAMAKSGHMVDLSSVSGVKVDKHSTGGVADTTTLVLAPLVAAAGVPVAKMSGRGLGFTGGTIDKLESIKDFKTTLSQEEFISNLKRFNVAVTGQSSDIAPADGKMYALRDVTATVDSIPLIASSIMSKKIAAGADKILLDVKVGNGAFMKRLEDAVTLAETMVHIGELVGRETRAVISNMDEPLGQAIGNSLEVEEAIDILDGRGVASLRDVCLTLGAHMLIMAGKAAQVKEAFGILEETLNSKAAFNKFKEFIKAQGGNPAIADNPQLLPQAGHRDEVFAQQSGYIQSIDAAQIGYCAMKLGAGREYKGQEIDLSAGIMLKCRVGDYIEKGQRIATIHSNDKNKVEKAKYTIKQSININQMKISPTQLILGIVDKNGFKKI